METPHSNDVESLEVVVLYPDKSARERVFRVLESLQNKISSAFQMNISGGRFDHLEDPMVRDCLSNAIGKADILCIASRGHTPLPETITRWISQISYPEDRRPLLALVNLSNPSGSEVPRDAQSFLEGFAKGRDMDFLEYHMTDALTPAGHGHGNQLGSYQWSRTYPGETSSLNE